VLFHTDAFNSAPDDDGFMPVSPQVEDYNGHGDGGIITKVDGLEDS
jgi:hypothetical protein